MIRDHVKEYFLQKDYNCAESIFLAANRELGLGLSEADARLVSAFGGGMGCGSVCGALAGAMAVLGYCCVRERAHATAGFGGMCAALKEAFEARMGGILCQDLKPRYATPEQRCAALVEEAADVLEAQLRELEARGQCCVFRAE